MTINFWLGGGQNDWSYGPSWYPGTPPYPGDLDIDQGNFNSGTIFVNNLGITNQTVWLYPTATATDLLDLNGSSIGTGSLLLTNGVAGGNPVRVTLHNSGLYGEVFAGSGTTDMTVDAGFSAINYGWIGIANTTSPDSLTISGPGAFANNQLIEVGTNGSFTLSFGASPTGIQYWENSGILQADPGGLITVQALQQRTGTYGTLINTGQINANAGTIVVDSTLLQSPNGVVNVANDSTLVMNGDADGGTILINNSMLDLGQSPPYDSPGPFAAAGLDSTIGLTGDEAQISFKGYSITEAFNATTDVLTVMNAAVPGIPIAQLHLEAPTPLSAANFSISNADGTNDMIVFTAHPVG